jgi:hypothetical protein
MSEDKMKNIILGLTFVVAASAAALAGDSGGGGGEQVSFDTPSRNLCCTYTPAGGTAVYSTPDGSAELTCSREKPQYWTVSLTELGRYHVDKHPGEVPGCGNTDIIAYGETRHVGPFTCKSKTNGITCTVNAKGFTLSKSGLKKIN